jgi:hypothetical protein
MNNIINVLKNTELRLGMVVHSVISAPRRLRQEYHKLKVSLAYIARP